jgi:hypothetical protein
MLFAAGTRHAMARGMLGAARNVRNAYSGRRLVAPTRRAVLAVAATAAAAGSASLAGCKGLAALGPPPAPGPAVLALEHSIAAEEALVATYQAGLAAAAGHPVSGLLAAVLADHRAHLAALRSRLLIPPGSRARLARALGRRPVPLSLSSGQRQMAAELAAAERAAAARLTGQLLAAPPSLAQLLASIGASEAAHAMLLGRVK